MRSNSVAVVCDKCGWRTRRVWAPCECDGEYGCKCGPRVGYGACKNCGPNQGLRTPADIAAEVKFFAEAEEFWQREGAEVVARVERGESPLGEVRDA